MKNGRPTTALIHLAIYIDCLTRFSVPLHLRPPSQQVAQLTLGKVSQDQTLALALNYQLVTDQTNLILVHVREEGNKAEGLPELDKVKHMLAAGWGGVGSVDALHGGIAFSRFRMSSNEQMSVGAATVADYGSMSTPSVWRTRSVVSSRVDPLSISSMDDFEIPAFLRKQVDDSDFTANIKRILRPSPRKLAKGPIATPLAILQTFEASAQKLLAPHRFVSHLQALNLPAELVGLLDNMTVVLGTGSKAWALVLQWLTERMSDQVILSRQSERLLRQVLKGEDAKVLQELKLTWVAIIDAFMNAEFAAAGCEGEDEDFEIPAFLRKQAD